MATNDCAVLVKALRASGVDDDMIALAVMTKISECLKDEMAQYTAKFGGGKPSPEESWKLSLAMQDLQTKTLEELLGAETYRRYLLEHDPTVRALWQSGKFSEETIAKFLDVQKQWQRDMAELHMRMASKADGKSNPQAQWATLMEKYREDLDRGLGHDVAAGILAESQGQSLNLQQQLQGMKISEDEIDKAAQVQMEYQWKQQRLHFAMQKEGNTSGSKMRQRQEAIMKEMQDQLRSVLGPERYPEFEKRTDSRWQQLQPFAEYNRLSAEQVQHVYGVWKACMDRHAELSKYLETQRLSNEANQMREEAVKRINAETIESLEGYLGWDMYQRFRRSSGW